MIAEGVLGEKEEFMLVRSISNVVPSRSVTMEPTRHPTKLSAAGFSFPPKAAAHEECLTCHPVDSENVDPKFFLQPDDPERFRRVGGVIRGLGDQCSIHEAQVRRHGDVLCQAERERELRRQVERSCR